MSGLFGCKEMVEWKPVVGLEETHIVSSIGQVKVLRRLVRIRNGYRQIRERILPGSINSNGYIVCNISVNGICKTIKVHSVVAEAFCEKPIISGRLVVNHKDHNKQNNNASNLEWISDSDNAKKAHLFYGRRRRVNSLFE